MQYTRNTLLLMGTAALYTFVDGYCSTVQISKQRQRVHVSYVPSVVIALQHGTWMDEQSFKKTCIREKEKRGDIHQPFYGTWVADFMLREDAGRFML